jgi:potassium efflux system protein
VTRAVLAALILLAAHPHLPVLTTNAAPATNAAPVAAAAPVSLAIAPADIVTQAPAVLDKYKAPPAVPVPDVTETTIRTGMAAIEGKLQLLSVNAALLVSQNAPIESITALEKWSDYLASTIGTKTGASGWLQMISKRNDELSAKLAAIDKERAIWDDTAATLRKDTTVAPGSAQQIAEVQARLQAVKNETIARQKSLLQLQAQVAADGRQVTDALTALDAARTRAISRLFELNAPPVWAMTPVPEVGETHALTWRKQLHSLETYAQEAPGRFLLHGLLLVILIGSFWWLRGSARRLAQDEPGITPAAQIFETPVATALVVALGASPLFYDPIAPRLLSALLGALALLPCLLVLRRLIEPRLFPVLYALVLFYLLEEFRSVSALPVAGARLFLLLEILAAVSFLGWLLLRLRRGTSIARFSKLVERGARVAFAILSAGWLAEVLGFTLLANLICIAVQRAATLALALYAGIRIIEALLFIGMRLRPLSTLGMVRLHGPEVLRRASRLLVWVAVLTWAWAVLDAFPWSSDVNAHVFRFFARYDNQNNLTLTLPGRISTTILIGWGVFQLSRLARFTLETDLYPRLRLGAGVPYAISMSLHYALLTAAFIAATAVLGVDMTKFTILVSALGVGVGFGLQNIINNFVSGLILLFERPVKIGDTVQTGADTGTVERIGIRASVLRTAVGTEVIVPNGSLISSNVTNWTLSSRERIILIPLNVPRGPDIPHLVALLTATAAAHPKVLKNPPPRVIAQTLGVNLGLELRAWTGSTGDWTEVRSELVLAVSAELAKENIILA